MNLRAVGRMLGTVLLLLAGFMVLPALVGIAHGEVSEATDISIAAAMTAAVGGVLRFLNTSRGEGEHRRPDFFRREGLTVVGLSWVVSGIAGALPYLLSGPLYDPVDAFFESVSGFTTTGSTVMSGEQIDGMSKTIAFWRSFTHWLGGFGIVMVFVVLFPTGGRSLFRSEIPGIAREAGHQRVRDSALMLMRMVLCASGRRCAMRIEREHNGEGHLVRDDE